MGISIIIPNADFSDSGFVVGIDKKDYTELKNAQDSVVTSYSDVDSNSKGLYYYEDSNGKVVRGYNYTGAASLIVSREDYTNAEITTVNTIPPYPPTVLGPAIILFADDSDSVLGGLSTAIEQGDLISTAIGSVGKLSRFALKIPTGCTKIICSYRIAPDSAFNDNLPKFKLSLSKVQ